MGHGNVRHARAGDLMVATLRYLLQANYKPGRGVAVGLFGSHYVLRAHNLRKESYMHRVLNEIYLQNFFRDDWL